MLLSLLADDGPYLDFLLYVFLSLRRHVLEIRAIPKGYVLFFSSLTSTSTYHYKLQPSERRLIRLLDYSQTTA